MGCGVDDSVHFVNLFAQGDSIYYHENPSVAGWSVSDYRCFLAAYPEPDMLDEVRLMYCINELYGKRHADQLPDLSGRGKAGEWIQWAKQHFPLVKWLSLWRAQYSDHYARYDLSLYTAHPEWVDGWMRPFRIFDG